MIYVITILRLAHIIAAFVWFGLAVASTLFINPTAIAAGESGIRYLKQLYTQTAFKIAFPICAGVTTLMGILLYLTSDTTSNFSDLGRLILGFGAVTGLAAMVHSIVVTDKLTTELSANLTQYVTAAPILSAEGALQIRDLLLKLSSGWRVGLALTTIALVAMGSARYL